MDMADADRNSATDPIQNPVTVIYVVLDGLSDQSYDMLDGETPLQAADTPHMNRLARNGETGFVNTVRHDIAPESDQGMLALLGYNPFQVYTGRGILEAVGADVEFDSTQFILRGNFAVENKNREIQRIEANISGKEAEEYAQLLNTHLDLRHGEAEVVPTTEYRNVVLLRSGRPVSGRVSNTHPGYEYVENNVTTALPIKNRGEPVKRLDCIPIDNGEDVEAAANLVDTFVNKASQLLKEYDCNANTVLTRGASFTPPPLESMPGNWALLADMPVEHGIGELSGMNTLEKGGNTASAYTIAENLDAYNGLYVQIKAPDKASHRGNVEEKVAAIEAIDRDFFGTLLTELDDEDVVICVTADHSSECAIQAHTDRPVPVLVSGTGVDADAVKTFTEGAVKEGRIGHLETGQALFARIREHANL